MAKKILWWSKDGTRCVDAAKIREITMVPTLDSSKSSKEYVPVRGWFNDIESFWFGDFPTVETARAFVDALPKE